MVESLDESVLVVNQDGVDLNDDTIERKASNLNAGDLPTTDEVDPAVYAAQQRVMSAQSRHRSHSDNYEP